MKILPSLLCILICMPVLRADEEEFLAWKSVTIKCANESTPAGAVSCEIATGDSGYASFTIHAFGKEFKLSAEELAKLKDFPLTSLSSRHSAGYKELGGYSVYFRFERKFYEKEKLKTEVLYVTVTETKGLKVGDVQKQ